MLVVDARLPDGSGSSVLRLARERQPCISIVAYTAHGEDHEFANAAHEVGAEYAQKPAPIVQVLLRRLAIRRHHSDERFLRAVDGWASSHGLSPCETEVLALAMLDYSYKEMADVMEVKLDTIRGFSRSISKKSNLALTAIACKLRRELRLAA